MLVAETRVTRESAGEKVTAIRALVAVKNRDRGRDHANDYVLVLSPTLRPSLRILLGLLDFFVVGCGPAVELGDKRYCMPQRIALTETAIGSADGRHRRIQPIATRVLSACGFDDAKKFRPIRRRGQNVLWR